MSVTGSHFLSLGMSFLEQHKEDQQENRSAYELDQIIPGLTSGASAMNRARLTM